MNGSRSSFAVEERGRLQFSRLRNSPPDGNCSPAVLASQCSAFTHGAGANAARMVTHKIAIRPALRITGIDKMITWNPIHTAIIRASNKCMIGLAGHLF